MEIVTQEGGATSDVMGNLPMIEDEASLKALLGVETPPASDEGDPAKPGEPEKKKEPAVKNPTIIGDSTPSTDDDEDDQQNEGGNEEGKKVDEYPSVLHYLNETHKLGLNLEENPPTKEDEAEAISEVITRMTQGVANALEEYQYIDQLLQDPEVTALLEAKKAGKGLNDLYSEYVVTPDAMNDDDLVMKSLQTQNPKSPPEVIKGMVDALKKNAQFEPFVKAVREQIKEEQSFSMAEKQRLAEEQAKVQAEAEKRELQQYVDYVGALTQVHNVPLTKEMKAAVVRATTQRDEAGNTWLDHALQSNEGTVLATLGILYMKDMLRNAASLEGNRKNARFVDKIFTTPEKLQGGSGTRQNKDQDYDPELIGRF